MGEQRKSGDRTGERTSRAKTKPGSTQENSSGSGNGKHASISEEQHYSVAEVARRWGTDPTTIRSLFKYEPGVIKLSQGARKKRTTLKIPKSVMERVHQRLRAK